MKDNDTCKTLCVVPDVNKEDAKFINDRIREDYAMNWLIDGLPAAEMKYENNTGELFFDIGFNLGDNEGEHQNQPALNNHFEIVLRYWFATINCAAIPEHFIGTTSQLQKHIG